MRYKAYVIQGYRSLYTGSLVLARQGNNFVDAKELAGVSNKAHPAYRFPAVTPTNLKNCTEIKDGIYFLKREVGDIFIIPESHPFFNTSVILKGLDDELVYLEVKVRVPVIKYLRSLKP